MTETTTDAATQDTGAQVAQPDEQPAEAVTTPDSEPEKQPETEEPGTPDNSEEPETDSKSVTPEWLQAKGLDPSVIDDPEKLKLANMAFNSEKAMSKSRQQSSEIEKQAQQTPTVDGGLSRTDQVVNAMLFKQSHPDFTEAQDVKMAEYISANPQKEQMLNFGLLSYDDVYHMSGAAGMGQPDPATLRSQGGKEALQTLANKQRATAPKGAASQPNAVKSDPIEEVLRSD